MKTTKKSKCEGNCCTTKTDSNFEQKLMQEALDCEKSECSCIKLKTECGADCGCDPEICRNRQMSRRRALVEGIDFEERTAWGIDLCTAINLLDVLPRDIPLD